MTAHANLKPRTTGSQEALINIGRRVGIVGIGLLTQGLLAYTLGPEGRGAYAVCVTFAVLLAILLTLSVDKGAQYHMIAGHISLSQGFSLALFMCLVGSILTAAATLPLIQSGLAFFRNAETSSFYWSVLLIPLAVAVTMVDLFIAGLRRFMALAYIFGLRAVVLLIAMVVLVWHMDYGVDGALAAMSIGYVCQTVSGFGYLRRRCGLVWEWPDWRSFGKALGYGLRYHPAYIGTASEAKVGTLALSMLATRYEIGLFAVATLLMYLVLVSQAVGITMYPRILNQAEEEQHQLMGRCMRFVVWITGLMLLGGLVLAVPMVRLWFSPAFLPVVPLMWIMAPGILCYAVSDTYSTYFSGVNQPQIGSWAVWLGLGTNVAMLLTLYPLAGLHGAAWAMTIGHVCRCGLLALVFHRNTRVPLRSVWLPRRSDLVYAAETLRTVFQRAVSKSALGA